MKNKKVLYIIIGIVLVLLIGLIIIINPFKKDKEENNNVDNKPIEKKVEVVKNLDDLNAKAKEIGAEYYETYYYPYNEKIIPNFSINGIHVSLYDIEKIMTYSEDFKKTADKNKCDLDKSEVIIYPTEPFKIKDYKVEVSLNCK